MSTTTGDEMATKLGVASGVWAAAMALGFAVAVSLGTALYPSPTWTGDAAEFAAALEHPIAWSLGEIFSLLIIPGWIGLAVALHVLAPVEKKPLSTVALLLTAAYAVTVAANDVVQITTVRLNLEAGTTDGLSLWIKDNPKSLFFALEMLGYAWQAFAVLLIGLMYSRPGIERWIRRLSYAVALSGALGLAAGWLGLRFDHPLTLAGAALWLFAFCGFTFLSAARLHTGRLPERA